MGWGILNMKIEYITVKYYKNEELNYEDSRVLSVVGAAVCGGRCGLM